MPALTILQIKTKGRDILAQSAEGVRWGDWVNKIQYESPDTPVNTISGALYTLSTDANSDVVKISRGIYTIKGKKSTSTVPGTDSDNFEKKEIRVETPRGGTVVSESSFYEPFAAWLKGELGDANEAVSLGSNVLGSKWGTPDVLGVLKPIASDAVKFPVQIISAEVKIDPNQPIVAFGQAIAYRLFSHKSYMVMPNTIAPDDLDRLEALAVIYGLGLVTFSLDPARAQFTLVNRAQSVLPDAYYVNRMAARIREVKQDVFNRLFS